MSDDVFRRWGAWTRAQAGRLALLSIGFAVGAGVFALFDGGEPRSGSAHGPGATPASRPGSAWTCSMHPQIRKPEPGACPICGMDLIPVRTDDDDHGDDHRIVLSDRARALAKLRTATVGRQADASAQLRLLGRIEPNETTLKTVTAWTGGRIDRLHVNVTGERVRAGQVIATLYSPEVFAAHQDLLVAQRQVERMRDSPQASQRAAAAAFEAARERLRLLGVPDAELARMARQERPTRSVAIRTPFSGTVIERMATAGAYVSTGTPLYRVANLRTLWVQLDAYESDLPRLSKGQPVRVTVEALPGEQFDGKITFIDPTLDRKRRTAQVRVQVDNQDGRLRPGMFAEATVSTTPSDEQRPLVVPATAPLFTGRRAIVYVEVRAGDRVGYEARTVRLGPRLGQVYPVVAGLSEGDRVVTRGAFALDADLQIRGGASMMASSDDREPGPWDRAIQLPAAQRARLAPVVSAYLTVQVALADDDLAPARAGAKQLVEAVDGVELAQPQAARAAWTALAGALRTHGQHVAQAKDLERARQGFEPLSQGIAQLLRRLGNPLDHPVRLAFCPMAAGSAGASWIQRGDKVDNAYFGASMLTCGEIREEVGPSDYLSAPEQARVPRDPHEGHQH